MRSFYLGINLGAFASTLTTPLLLEHVGSHAAFGLPGILMGVATAVFWLGRRQYTHVPPHGAHFVKEATSRAGLAAIGRLLVLYSFVAVFWSLYDQTGSAWVLQARHMDRHFAGIEWLPSQVGAVNPVLILILVPLFHGFHIPLPREMLRRQHFRSACAATCAATCPVALRFSGLYALLQPVVRVTPLRKIGCGFFLTAVSFLIPLQLQAWIEEGHTPSIVWHLVAYVILTVAEILVSVPGLEFSYTQAPASMKSVVMALWLLSVALGNALTALVNALILDEHGVARWSGVAYYRFFVVLMFVTAALFVPYAMVFKQQRSSLDRAPDA